MAQLWMIMICFLAERVKTSTCMDFTEQCDRPDNKEEVKAIQGEALYWPCPNLECSKEADHSQIYWYKNISGRIQEITTEKSARVHHHGPVLYILPLTSDDTGLYITRWWTALNNTDCVEFETSLVVGEKFHTKKSEITDTVLIICPVCEEQLKNLSWYKDFHLIPNESKERLYLRNTSKKDEGMYTCLCTWEHDGRQYNTSGSIHLQIKEPTTSFTPTIVHPRNNSVEFIDLGSEVVLNCSAFFGINIKKQCFVIWLRNNTRLEGVDGYTIHNWDQEGTFHSILTINKVSEVDLHSEFQCKAINLMSLSHVIITLKSRESVLPLVVMFLCTFLIFLLAAGTTKWFAVDLALFFRGLCIIRTNNDDGKVYDAYVIYQKDNEDGKTENSVSHFINIVLPAVLENSCGFKLYIHGRDDLPGEDSMELIETRMKLSRRLIVVLTTGMSHGQEVTIPQGYDWQMGLYQVLVQQEMSMILIQLGDTKDYSHLPLAMQHLLQKTPPLKWNEKSHQATSPSSRFWKRVRYMMPIVPAQVCPNSSSAKYHCQEFCDTHC
ncbi:interleukin-1 receptor type 1 isoform X2 [Salminus brasiliensis]|uniref:interleukin-1 receptor type 1 isoform X2 n=1 Tax=Salminus brasiliensis TaxID=930266 RepID=UPI003B831863